jgi:hypothetical protein
MAVAVGWTLSLHLQLLSAPSLSLCAAASLLQELVGWLLTSAGTKPMQLAPPRGAFFMSRLDERIKTPSPAFDCGW